MPQILERDGKYCLDGYGDADTCYDSEDEAKAAVEKLTADKALEVQSEVRQAIPALSADAEKSLFERIWDGIQARLGSKDAEEQTSFKTVGNAWVIAWSNNFEDRDGEIFTAKAMDDYVARVDSGITPPPELWLWHVPGTRIGKAEWVARHGHFLVASGSFDDTPTAQKAKAYYGKHASKTGVSHGFTFPVTSFDGRHYKSFNTFEISLLPRGSEANLYTSLEGVKAMPLSENKKKYLLDAGFEPPEVERIIASWEAKGKALDELGVASKDFVAPDTLLVEANKQAVANAEKAFRDLVPNLMEGSAEAVSAALEAVKGVKATNSKVAELEKQIDALRAEMQLAPRSVTQGGGAVLDPESAAGKALLETVQAGLVEIDPLFKVAVRKPV